MNIREYQNWAKTKNKCAKQYQKIHLIAGLQAEIGEVSELIQKFYRDVMSDSTLTERELSFQNDLVRLKLNDELGDVMWYISELASEYELSLDRILEENQAKLEKRYNKS